MKEVRKKSADSAVNQMLVKAYRQQTDLAWDRAEAMQPQCGFGRLAICCSDCAEGPCRVNPFAAAEQRTTCGRTQAMLVANQFYRKAADGAAALAGLAADFGADLGLAGWRVVAASRDAMLADCGARLREVGQTAGAALMAIAVAKEKAYGVAEPDTVAVNLGALKADAANIVLHGHVAPQTVKALAKAAGAAGVPVNLVSVCGSEYSGEAALAILTNYDSQEVPLLTGAVDLLVLGSQCVMPAVTALATKLGVPTSDGADADQAVAMAVAAFKRRAGKTVDIPAVGEEACTGYTAANCDDLIAALAKAHAQGAVRGLLYFGGCNNIAHTQDSDLVKAAAALLAEGYVLLTAGCAGTALAKAGLCQPGYAGAPALTKVLPVNVPPVLHLGSCHDAGLFPAFAKAAAAKGLPVAAVLPEITHNKTLATAVAFAAAGVTTFVGLEEAGLPESDLGAFLLPLADCGQLPRALAEAAAAK
jgi:hydroxylamine reductase (hybrid-cluster protein)